MANYQTPERYSEPSLRLVLKSIAQRIKNYREAFSTAGQLAECDPDEVERIARDLQIAPRELARVSMKGPDSSRLLLRMLAVLGVDFQKLSIKNPAVLRDLQRLCVSCGYKQNCELIEGAVAKRYADYCPNAYTLDALLEEAGIDQSLWDFEQSQ